MKGTIIGFVGGCVGGFVVGCLLTSDGNVGSLVLGIVMAMLMVIVLGAVVILLAGVVTRNMQPKQIQRQASEYPQPPYIMFGGPSQPQASFGEPNNYRQLPIVGNKQQVEYEDF